MKSLFILAGVVMMMLTGCGSDSGSYSTESADVVETESPVVVSGSSINEPTNLPGMNTNVPPVPAFPGE